MRPLRWLLALALAACSSSHGTGVDGGADASADSRPPSACGPCDQPCCTRDPATGATVAPFCPGPMMECEGPPVMTCDTVCGPAPSGCAWDGLPPSCDCSTPVCADPCGGLSETGCWAAPGCAPVYDDDCCSLCRPIGACADCVDPVFFVCVREDEVCGPAADPCGHVPSCGGGALDCTDAVPDLDRGSCSIAGCVPALQAGCLEGCELSCRPVTGGSCEAACDIVEPPCPDGMVAEADGGCYTGFCIPGAVCGR